MVLFCIYTPLLMYKLHVKLNYQAFMLIHVVEQVQLFKWEQLILITSTSESGNVRGDKVAPMKPAILTWLVKVGGALAKKKMSKIHVWKWWRSGGCCVLVWGISFMFYFSPPSVFGGCTRSVFESDYTQQNRRNAHREMWSCAGMHQHSAVMCTRILMFIICLVLGKGLSCRSEVATVGFHAQGREMGATCERAWPRRGAKTKRIPNKIGKQTEKTAHRKESPYVVSVRINADREI